MILKCIDCWHPQKNKVILVLLLLFFCYTPLAVADYVIGAGDALSIKIHDHQELTTETRVSERGLINIPLVGDVNLSGQSAFEAGRTIAELLAKQGIVKNAQVTVFILDYKSQQVSVLGQVNKPGVYSLDAGNLLTDVLALAGGINQLGEDRVIITHQNDNKIHKEVVDLRNVLEYPSQDRMVAVSKGDIIFVPKASMFYIYGEVQRPGSFRIEPEITVAQAISLGGGLTPRGTLRGITIVRRDQSGLAKTVEVDLTDAVLKDDVVFVDERLF